MNFTFNLASLIPSIIMLIALVVGFFKIRTIIQDEDTEKTIHIVHDELRKNEPRYNDKLSTLIESKIQPHCDTQRQNCKSDFNRIHERMDTLITTVHKNDPNGKIEKIEKSLEKIVEDNQVWRKQFENL